MRKSLILLTAFTLASCGGGGGGSASSSMNNPPQGSGGTTTSTSAQLPTKGLTFTTSTRALGTEGPLFRSGQPVLACNSGDYLPTQNGGTFVNFQGGDFNNCTLTMTASDGTVVETADQSVSGNGTVTVDNNLNVLSSTAPTQPLAVDNYHMAVRFENKKFSNGRFWNRNTLYGKTVIIVMEGDNIPDNALTDYLKKDYNYLASSDKNQDTKFIVIWDGGLKSGGNGSDIFILDPGTGKTFSALDNDIQAIENGSSVLNYANDGILYFYAPSDNLSVHFKQLVRIAEKIAPAKSYDLIVADHGNGWVSYPTPNVRAVMVEQYDGGNETGSVWLGSKQFADDLRALTNNGQHKFGLLGLDECLMGEFTTLNLFAPYANVIVASPEYEMGNGWASVYKSLPNWYQTAGSTWDIAKDVADGYINYYKQNPPNVPLAYPQTIGLTTVKTTSFETLRQPFEKFAGSLKNTAENEVNNGQMYKVFYSWFSNNQFNTYTSTFLGNLNSPDYLGNDTTAETFENAANQYFGYYGSSEGTNILGYDLVGTVAKTGYAARLVELGCGHFDGNYEPFNGQSAYIPQFDPNTAQNALNFLNTYNQVKGSGGIYTRYLTLNMDGTVNTNMTSSGLSLIYPYTSPDGAESPKLNLCNYQNFVESYKGVLPNYAGFVDTVFGEMWKAVKDAGLYGNGTGQFTCNAVGNVVWNQ